LLFGSAYDERPRLLRFLNPEFKTQCNLCTQDEPKRLLCSVSKQLLYVLNNHQPLQLKINELFEKYSKKKEKETKEDVGRWNTLEEVGGLDETNEMMPEQDHGIGLNQDHRIVSNMLDYPGTAYVPPSTILPMDTSSTVKNEHLKNEKFDKSINNVVHCQT